MKTLKRYLLSSVFLALIALLAGANTALAGFGISPPYVKNNQIVPGSHYSQVITLLRSSAEEDLRAEITVNAPEIAEWITIDKGTNFLMPKGQLQVPMTVNIDPPAGAEIGNYTGHINIRMASANEKQGGGVAIALGARVDVDLTLTNVTFSDFFVRLVSIPDTEKLGKPWNWKYLAPLFDKLFYRVRVAMTIENKGNVDTAPTKVQLDVYDLAQNKLLESSEDTSMKKVEPFLTSQVEADFPTSLSSGQYWGKIKIYKDNEITNTYKLAFTIAEPGGLGGKARSLGPWPWVVLGGLALTALILTIILIKIRVWKYPIALIVFIITKPLGPVWRGLAGISRSINAAFWRWIRQKAEKYDQ